MADVTTITLDIHMCNVLAKRQSRYHISNRPLSGYSRCTIRAAVAMTPCTTFYRLEDAVGMEGLVDKSITSPVDI
jgi:hypothetical protein